MEYDPSDGSFVEVGPEHGPLPAVSRQNYPSTVSRAEILNSLEPTLMMGASEFGIPKCACSRQDISIPTENTAMGKERII